MNPGPMCRAHELRHPAPPGPLYAESSTTTDDFTLTSNDSLWIL